LVIVAVAVPVAAYVLTGVIAAQLTSFGPGHAPASVCTLAEIGSTAAPGPVLVAFTEAAAQESSQVGAGGAEVPLLFTVALTSAFEPPSQSTQPAVLDSMRRQMKSSLASDGCCALITTGFAIEIDARPLAPTTPPTTWIGPEAVKLPRVKLQIVP